MRNAQTGKASGLDLQTIGHHINAANAANLQGDFSTALGHCRKVLRAQAEIPEAWYNRGIAERGLGNRSAAIESQNRAAALAPNSADALNSIGLELVELGAYPDAEQCLNRAIALAPNHAYALSNKAYLFQSLGRYEAAEELLRRAISIQPNFAPFHANLGAILNERTLYGQAEAALQRAVELDPRMAQAWNNLANALSARARYGEAESACRKAIALNPGLHDAYWNLGDILRETGRHAESLEVYARLAALAPKFEYLKGRLLYSKMQCCDWSQFNELLAAVNDGVRKRRKAAHPFGYQAVSESTRDLFCCASVYANAHYPALAGKPDLARPLPSHDRIRLGYVSGEFRTQATTILMAGLFEHHDKSRFTITAFDNGESDRGEHRARLERAFDEIVDIAGLGDQQAAEAIAAREIDVLINLNGYFGRGRQGVFSRRPSPVQVNYPGFPGTIGADYIDYLIADATVIPEDRRGDYAERVVYLPESYQANDDRRVVSDRVITREEAGLPPEGFVFCCFNNSYKITPGRFEIWMRILRRVDGSVLWLLEDNALATANLKREAASRGVDAGRLVFGQRLPLPDHLARHRLADLFIDTLPYNAHTTASDALWVGVPVLTQTGTTFPGRVAASLLKAIGLPDLITERDAEYEALAVELATDRQRLLALRDRLDRNRLTTPLFDTARFTRHIEAAFAAMYERRRSGLQPDHIRVKREEGPAGQAS